MGYHSGMTICHKANIWYTSHNMYQVYQSITSICAMENINLNSENQIVENYHDENLNRHALRPNK